MPVDPAAPVTAAGRRRLQSQLDTLIGVERPQMLAAALSLPTGDAGDLAEGRTAQEALARLDERIRAIQEQLLARPPATPAAGVAGLGSVITVDFGDGPETLLLGNAGDVEAGQDVVTRDSPLGRAIQGAKATDTVHFTGPTGRPVTVAILNVR